MSVGGPLERGFPQGMVADVDHLVISLISRRVRRCSAKLPLNFKVALMLSPKRRILPGSPWPLVRQSVLPPNDISVAVWPKLALADYATFQSPLSSACAPALVLQDPVVRSVPIDIR